MNLLYVFEHGDAVLTLTFVLLLGMSAASWYIIFWKAWQIRKEKAHLASFTKKYVTTADWPRHMNIKSVHGGASLLIKQYRDVKPVLSEYKQSARKEILGMHLAQTLDTIRAWSDKGLTILASVGSSAPFIGLFGTVWGIYGALTKISTEGNASLNVVAGPMGEALVATAVGLFAAIPAVLAYNTFIRVNRLLIQDYRHIAEHLTTYLSYDTKDTTIKSDKPLKLVTKGN
jgi:biopolymer transport protein ExbB